MDPNNTNQPQQPNPVPQPPEQPAPAAQPVSQPTPPAPAPEAPTTPAPFVNAPKGGHKLTFLLIIFLILLVGLLAYFYFMNRASVNNPTVETLPTTPLPSPTFTPTPTPQSPDAVEVESPDTDLLDLENDLKSL